MVAERCPNAVRCADAFHVVAWATDALDEVRRQAWNEARGALDRRRAGRASGHARALKHARYALWKNPENLTDRQHAKLAWIAKTDPGCTAPTSSKKDSASCSAQGRRRQRSPRPLDQLGPPLPHPRLRPLQRRIVKHRAAIDAALDSGLSNALIESTNTKIRLITRVAFGFHGPEPLIALAMLSLGAHPPVLPGRMTHGSVEAVNLNFPHQESCPPDDDGQSERQTTWDVSACTPSSASQGGRSGSPMRRRCCRGQARALTNDDGGERRSQAVALGAFER